MALDGDMLYIADTENHLIRKVNLKARTVETLAGTGRQSTEYFKEGTGRSVGLNSPWDLQLVGRTLYIAMAGPHQIWKLDLDKDHVSTFAGSDAKRGSMVEPELRVCSAVGYHHGWEVVICCRQRIEHHSAD